MRNIFLFIRRYFTFIIFLVLQGFSIYLIIHYSLYHNSIFSNTANQITGKINEQYNKVDYYFKLKQTNDSLLKANALLYDKLKENYQLPDTTSKNFIDSIRVDSIFKYKKYSYLPAKVVSNSVSNQNNFILINRGSSQGIIKGMGVIDINNTVVGIVTDVSENYAVVMSLLHKDNSKLSAKLFKTGEAGTISWDGKQPNILMLTGIPNTVTVAVGDSVISSGYSTSFPKGLMMGTVLQVMPDKASSNLLIKIKSSTNFYNVEMVYAIDNKQQQPINDLLNKTKPQNN